jgi:hypothetical protein
VARKGFGLSPKEDKSGLGCGKEYGCSLSSTVDGSGVWQVLLVWPWPRPSWTTLYTCAPTKCVPLILSILIFGPCFRHTLECTKVEDTSTQLKQTTKQPCKQKVLVVKSSIFTLEKISLHKFGIEFNQKFNDYVSIRILVLYDVVRPSLHMSQRGSNLRLSQLHPLRPSHADQWESSNITRLNRVDQSQGLKLSHR